MVLFKLFFDKDKETVWLNEMADKGWAMTRFFMGFYTFEACEKGQYRYQIDFGDRFCGVTDDYRDFMTEAGIGIVQTWGYWVVLRKPASEGEFQLYTDVDSQIGHYTKIKRMFKIVCVFELICLFVEIIAGIKTGKSAPFGFACLLLALVIVFLRAVLHTGNIIADLKERKTGIPEPGRKQVSVWLAIGMLLNSIALLTRGSEAAFAHPLTRVVQILALILMICGIYETVRDQRA